MFANIRRHQKWLWLLISTAVIVSFVVYFNPQQRYMRGMPRAGGADSQVGSIYGHPVLRSEYLDTFHEAELRYLFSYGEWPGNDETTRMLRPVERETRNRILLLEKVRQADIKVDDPAVADWIREAFKDREQKSFRKDAYERFVKEQLPQHGLRMEDFERFVRHEVAIQHLVQVAGLPGKLVTPQEAEADFRREHEQLQAQIVIFNSSNYLAQVKIDPAAIATFYTNQQSRYRLPERVQVSYVGFEASNFLAQADARLAQQTNLSLIIDQEYARAGADFFKDTNGQVLPATAAKERIKNQYRENFALRDAREKAIGFATELLEMQPRASTNLEKLASAKGLTVHLTEPFSQFEPPKGLPDAFGRVAFALSPEEPFAEQPIVGESGVYVIAFKRRIPSEMPSLDSIRDRVTEDYKKDQAQNLARAAGLSFQTAVTNALASAKSFEQAAEASKLTVVKLPPFSQVTRALPELETRGVDLSSVKNAVQAIGPKQTTPFVQTRSGGFVAYLDARTPAPENVVKEEFPTYLTQLRRSKQMEAFNDWFRHEMEVAHLQLPGDDKLAQTE